MINRRGLVVVLIFTLISVTAGFNVGSFRKDLMWRADWTALQVASVCKGDRL